MTCTAILVDISGTTEDSGMRDRYRITLEQLLTSFKADEYRDRHKGGEYVIVDAVTENPWAQALWPLEIKIPPCSSGQPSVRCHAHARKEIAKQTEEWPATIERWMESRSSGSALLDMISVADVRLRATPCETAARQIIVISDMVEESEDYHFAGDNLTQERVGDILNILRTSRRLPDLKGAEVWVAGATAVDHDTSMGPLSTDQILGIRRFWLAYFQAAGANLPASRYCTTMCGWPVTLASKE